MKQGFKLLLLVQLFVQIAAAQSVRTLDFYIQKAHENTISLNQNLVAQQTNLLQNTITQLQLHKPQVFMTSDYLFAPYFGNNGKLVSITTSPENNAYGYDVNQTNGGLYALQLNATTSLFTGGILKSLNSQTAIQNQSLQNNYKQLVHDLDKTVTDQFIAVYQLQQQQTYIEKTIALVEDRKKVVQIFVEKGLLQQTDYLLTEISLTEQKNSLQQQQIALSSAFLVLNNTCGISDTSFYILSTPDLKLNEKAKQFNFREKYQLDSLTIVTQLLVNNIKYRPQLNAYGSTGMLASDASNIPHNVGLSAGLHLNIPIYDGGQKKVVEQQSKLQLQNLQQAKNIAEVQQENNLNSLLQQIGLTRQSVVNFNQQLKQQETLLGILKDKVITGQISLIDYLTVVDNYVQTNQNKIQNETNLWLLINQYNYVNW